MRKIGHTNYDVADQLSNMGMEAIHSNAAKTLRQSGVALRVTNAFDPQDSGTLIDESQADHPSVEIVTGLNVVALELFEQDMVGVKGYDSSALEALRRHNVRIVSKVSNANTITHYVEASLKKVRRVIGELERDFPCANISARNLAIVSVIGRQLRGLQSLRIGLEALNFAGVEVIAAQQNSRNVDIKFVVSREDAERSIKALHTEMLNTEAAEALTKAA